MTAFYNEYDPYAAQWLRNLIAAGHIAPGIVDERPIQEIEPYELVGFTQCHFFAGIGIWSLALRRAGFPDDFPIWTGSCPCQPFSAAGQQRGFDDARHLWPVWERLIAERRPPVVLGEQVASKDGLQWVDLVHSQMERADYAFGASDLCAAGFGQAHIRQRLYFAGLADPTPELDNRSGSTGPRRGLEYPDGGAIGGLADASGGERHGFAVGQGSERHGETTRRQQSDRSLEPGCTTGGLADALPTGRPERGTKSGNGSTAGSGSNSLCDQGQIAERWLDVDWLLCRNPAGEPSWRPVEPGSFPLAHGVSNRMGKLRAYGNALDVETATAFASTVYEICADMGLVG